MLTETNVQSIQFVRVFPWLRLGRAIGCALAPTQLIIALAVVLCWTILIDALIWSSGKPEVEILLFSRTLVSTDNAASLVPPLAQVYAPELSWPGSQFRTWTGIVLPGLMYFLWTIAGVAICRSTAVQFCREEGPSFRHSLQWSIGRCPSSLTSLLTPLGFLLMMGVVVAGLALPGIVPGLGTLWLKAVAPFQAVLMFGLLAILALLPILWPLIVAAVAIDDSDAFDAFSRSFSLITSRPWATLALLVLCAGATLVVGKIVELFSLQAPTLALQCCGFFLGESGRSTMLESLLWWSRVIAATLLSSLFWSHATIVYLFLRQVVDGTPLDTLAGYDDDMRFQEPFPVVGIPAVGGQSGPAQQPVATP